jgi:hypothetical protein
VRLYYFTAWDHACENIENHRIKISDPRYLNDPFEFVSFKLKVNDSPQKREAVKKYIENSGKGIICFSRTYKSPLMWAHYASNHSGVCMGFDVNPDLLAKVRYRGDLMIIDETRLTERVVMRMLSTKYNQWSYEKEERLFVSINNNLTGIQFELFSSDIKPVEVIIGIRSEKGNEVVEAVQKSGLGLKVFKANRSLSSFNVERFEFFKFL